MVCRCASADLDGLSLEWHTPRAHSPSSPSCPYGARLYGRPHLDHRRLGGGLLASLVMGGIGYGILGDIVIGILGALFGGWLFSRMGWGAPAWGIAGTIFVAFIGAVVLLLIIRLLRGARRTP